MGACGGAAALNVVGLRGAGQIKVPYWQSRMAPRKSSLLHSITYNQFSLFSIADGASWLNIYIITMSFRSQERFPGNSSRQQTRTNSFRLREPFSTFIIIITIIIVDQEKLLDR